MKHVILTAMLAAGIAVSGVPVFAQNTSAAAGSSLGSVTLTKKVLADGQPLAPGTYQVRLTGDMPKPGVGQSPDGERYVEFLKAGKVVGREVATVVSNADIGTMAKWNKPAPNSVKVETLK